MIHNGLLLITSIYNISTQNAIVDIWSTNTGKCLRTISNISSEPYYISFINFNPSQTIMVLTDNKEKVSTLKFIDSKFKEKLDNLKLPQLMLLRSNHIDINKNAHLKKIFATLPKILKNTATKHLEKQAFQQYAPMMFLLTRNWTERLALGYFLYKGLND